MYYIISNDYIGTNRDQRHIDGDNIVITTTPGRTNMSNEVRIEGWLGSSNDWSRSAHGLFNTEDAARAAIPELFGECREDDDLDEYDDDDIIARFRPGSYAPYSAENTIEWAYEGIRQDIDAATTNERIDERVAEYEADANADLGITLDEDALRDRMIEYRDDLRGDD